MAQEQKRTGSWREYHARLVDEFRNGIDSQSHRYSQITKPDGTVITFRSAADMRTELNMAEAMVLKEGGSLGADFSPFLGEMG
jgi:hypothetical protein